MNTRQLLKSLVAARARARPVAVPMAAPITNSIGLPELRALQRRVVAARLGGDSRPVKAARALFDDVQ
jgi:hypothetical protein